MNKPVKGRFMKYSPQSFDGIQSLLLKEVFCIVIPVGTHSTASSIIMQEKCIYACSMGKKSAVISIPAGKPFSSLLLYNTEAEAGHAPEFLLLDCWFIAFIMII
jgi:hypothetical protein